MTEMLPVTLLAQAPRYTVRFARTEAEIIATQKLRYRIFAGELGADIDGGADGLDTDKYDAHCQHLMVLDNSCGEVIACTRILTEDAAVATGGFYSASEFDLEMIEALRGRFTVPERSEVGAEAAPLPPSRTPSRYARNSVSGGSRVMEIGRTCVAAEHRSGAVIATLWQGIAETVTSQGYDYLFGCASIGLEDGGAAAHAIIDTIRAKHMTPESQRVRPYYGLPMADKRPAITPKMPPLLKAYVSLGAKACGEAYWDRDFNCADVFMLLNVSDLNPRYARHFLARNTPASAEQLVALA